MTWVNSMSKVHVMLRRLFYFFIINFFYERLILRPTLTEVRETYIHVVDLDCD